jgi:hypothetical protein
MAKESPSAPGSPDNTAASNVDKVVRKEFGWRARALGRTLSRWWLTRVIAAAAGLAVGGLLSRAGRRNGSERADTTEPLSP